MFLKSKKKLKKTPLYFLWTETRESFKYFKWIKEGKPVPPPHMVKRKTVAEYAAKYGCKTFYESGTYLGDMVNLAKKIFNDIYSVELSEKLADKAKIKFSSNRHIHIIQGDSGNVIDNILEKIEEPCLFWLDGHYSGGITSCGDEHSPIVKEVSAIIKDGLGDNVILIDDARCFTGENGYPKLKVLKDMLIEADKTIKISVKDDIIRVVQVK